MEPNNEMTLKAFMKETIIDLRLFLSISLELTEMLRKLHLRGLIRYDLNPGHILIHPQSGRLAFQLIHPTKSIPDDEQTITQQAFAYISPEQTGRMKRKIGQRSDLYAIGVLFYELLTGELPFAAKTANEWIHAHMALLPVPPRAVKPEVPQIMNDLVLKLLSKSEEHRYQSAYGLHSDLQTCLDRMNAEGIIEPFSLGEADELSRFRLPETLYGREKKLHELLDAYDRSCSGSMEVVFIGGHAGSGKTALIKSFQMSDRRKKGYLISAKFDQLKQSIPYGSIIYAFRNLVRQILAEGEDQIAEWRKRFLEALGQSGNVIMEVISELTLIIGEQPPVEDLPPAESTNRFQSLMSSFIKVFADKKHPLVIVLDDLQWADPASLHVLQVLLHDRSNKYLFIVGTYRNNEIQEGHPVEETLFRNLAAAGTAVHYMNMEALSFPNVIRYVADALHVDRSRIKPLAEIIFQKTAGNPFYLKQMLQFIKEEKLLYFNSDKARWDWDLKSIKEWEGFQDVIGLIVGRFNTLPEETRQVLRLAGCIGNSFDIRMLSMLYDQETGHAEQDLLPALSEGLVLVEKETYTFLHDRVQQAAYDLLSDEEKKQVHLKIGRLLLRLQHSEQLDDYLFDIVHHLNLGCDRMTDRAEMEKLAQLNLQAGRKAKASAAYVSALALLKKGALLIEDEGWTRRYDLFHHLLLESSECEYFCGNFDRAEAMLAQLMLHAKHLAERAKIYEIQITMYAYGKKEGNAVDIAFKAMAEFGLTIPQQTSRLSITAEILFTRLWLKSKPSRLKGLPISRDPMHKALAVIVMAASASLFIVDQEKAVILYAKYVRMSLKQGNSEAFSFMLGSYASALCFGLKSYKTALRLAKVALRYSEQTDSVLLKGRIHFIMGLILQFQQPKQSGLHFQQSGQLGLEGGDMVFAGYAISSHVITVGGDLRHLYDLCQKYLEKASRALDFITIRVLRLTMQYVSLLQSPPSERLTFGRGHFDEHNLLNEEAESDTHKNHLYYYYSCKLEVYYLYGRYSEAAAIALEAVKYGLNTMPQHNQRICFYHALAIMAEYNDTSKPLTRNDRRLLDQLLLRMKRWTKIVPESTLSKYKLMLAELARLERDRSKAAELYDQAIHAAKEAGYPQDEAIANELAAQFALSFGRKETAEAYLQAACNAYCNWGAEGKAIGLQERYPFLKTLSFAEEDNFGDFNDNSDGEPAVVDRRLHEGLDQELDMETLRQASQIVSKDKEEVDLLESFLDLAIRNAGAEKGLVILGSDGKFVVEAAKEINRKHETTVDLGDSYSPAVVQFAIRTRESVILGEARQSIFASDPYIQRMRPKSILCLPIGYPDHRVGVLYLENNLAADAFTADRLAVLEMVFSRMAYLKLWQSQDPVGKPAESVNVKITPSLVESLSARDMDVLRLMAEGLSNKEIALRLGLTEGTVKSYAFNIYGKLQVKRRVQAVSKARELRLLD